MPHLSAICHQFLSDNSQICQRFDKFVGTRLIETIKLQFVILCDVLGVLNQVAHQCFWQSAG